MTTFLLLLLYPMELSYVSWPAFQSYLRGPGQVYPDSCGEMVDYDSDGDVDLADFALLQNEWSCRDEICGRLTMVEVP